MVKRLLAMSFTVLFTATCAALSGQSVKGVVRDSLTRDPMIGVTVVVRGQQVGTSTQADGSFSLNANPGDELELRFIGYKNQVVKVPRGNYPLNILLAENSMAIDEVLVVGFGQQKKASSVAAISQTDGSTLIKSASGVTNVAEALQGLMPGVISINHSAMPGEDQVELLIRGKATWQDSSPLILVDGVERDMNNIDFHEIDKISTLLDASATAVYGVRGANGVILITTKTGLTAKPVVSFSSNFGLKTLSGEITYADPVTTMEMYNEAARNDGLWNSLISESEIEAWRQNLHLAGPYNDYFPLVNMWEEITRNAGFSHNHNVNVTGGTDVMKYFASLGYNLDGDIFDTQKHDRYDSRYYFEKYNFRSNFDFSLTKTTSLSVKLSGNTSTQNSPGIKITYDDDTAEKWAGDNWVKTDFYDRIYMSSNFQFPIAYSDGTIGEAPDGKGNIKYALNNSGQRQRKTVQAFADVILKQDLSFLTEGLSAHGKLSYSLTTKRTSDIYNEGGKNSGIEGLSYTRYYRKYDLTSPIVAEDGSVSYPLSYQTRWSDSESQESVVIGDYDHFETAAQKLYYEFALNYARSFGDHHVSALALVHRNNIETSQGRKKVRFPSHEESWVGRVTYNWKERYLSEVNAAYNGSEKFAPGKRFGFFPSYSVGWRISEEPFVKESVGKWLTNLKVRYSYGKIGSDKGAPRFGYIQTYGSTSGYVFGGTNRVTSTDIYYADRMADLNSTWETATKQNLGVEATLFGKLNATVNLFHERREGILMEYRTLPLWLGTLTPVGNIGKTENRGYELELSWNERVSKTFSYWTRVSFTLSQNRIVFRDDPDRRADYMKDAGKPIGWVNGYLVQGYYTSVDDIFNSPKPELSVGQHNLIAGDFAYVDFNGDGVIDHLDMAPLRYTAYPMSTGSLSFGFKFKGFEFSAMFYGVLNQIKQVDKTIWDFRSGILSARSNVAGRWTVGNAAAGTVEKPALRISYVNHSQQSKSDFAYRSSDYLRLKNVELSYTFSGTMLSLLGVTKLQLYGGGNNLHTWTGLDKSLDPETESTSVYPIVKRYNMGVRITF